MSWVPFTPPPSDYPNHLTDPLPQQLPLARAAWVLAGLFLLCAAVRVPMALRIPSLCPDGVIYVQLAQALDAGDFQRGLFGMRLNVYPVILMLLHRLGLDWELAGAIWGVLIGSLVVLPLYGWVRRQFDDRVALVACLLYAFQPKTIAWSPEVMRDPTFWFLFTSAIYLLWRAVSEVRLRWFLLAGAAGTLACFTRFEGVFLFVPLGLWTLWRFRSLTTSRGRLLLGAVLCVVALPLFLLLVKWAWIGGRAGDLFRLDPLLRLWASLATLLDNLAGDGDLEMTPAPSSVPITFGRMVWIFFPTLTRGLSPVFALLMFGGLWGWRKVWGRRDHQALFYTALVFLVGIWVQLWFDRVICPRYAVPIMLMASPFAALALLGLTARIVPWTVRLSASLRLRIAAALAPLVVMMAVGFVDAMTCNVGYFALRSQAVDLGHWVRRTIGRGPLLVGPEGVTTLVGYYAGAQWGVVFRLDYTDGSIIVPLVRDTQPDVLLLGPTKQMDFPQCRALAARMKAAGFEQVAPELLPEGVNRWLVLVRRPMSSVGSISRPVHPRLPGGGSGDPPCVQSGNDSSATPACRSSSGIVHR